MTGLPRSIALVGMMGSGKTAVGRELAKALGWPLVDTDAEVEKEAGEPIPEIFRGRGEAAFRELERRVVLRAAARGGQVIATGGGAFADPTCREALLRSCNVVWLRAGTAELWVRLGGGEGRPLLSGHPDPEAALAELARQREPAYAQAPIWVETTGRRPEQVAAHVLEALKEAAGAAAQSTAAPAPEGDRPESRVVRVGLGPRSYPIHIGSGLLGRIGGLMAETLLAQGVGRRVLLVSHPALVSRFGPRVYGSLVESGFRPAIAEVPEGEGTKSLQWASHLYDRALEAGLDRHGVVLALGGGVVGDLAGFVAATYMRGIPFVQVPTSLLAQVDASVGGKVAVNHPLAKNLIGAFHQPRLVVADVGALESLPHRQLLSGLAEVVKHGCIADPELFAYLEQEAEAVLARRPAALARLVEDSCRIKAAVVEQDEEERTGQRALLNFGHTLGHGLESVAGYGEYTHGEAVAVGMVVAARLSVELGRLEPGQEERIRQLIARLGLPVRPLPAHARPEALWAAMLRDKKVKDQQVRFVLLCRIGQAAFGQPVPFEAFRRAWRWALEQPSARREESL